MGHKVNPYGFRLGVIYPWKSNWYADRDYSEQLHEDIWIRKHIRKRLSRAGISSIDIERKGDQIWVFIRTARPGIVIGRKGAEVDRIRKDIERFTKKRVDVKVEDMNQAASESRPETDAALLAQGVAEQLAGRVAFRRAMRRAVQTSMRSGALGVKVHVRRPPGRHRDVPQRVVPRGPRPAAHPARQGRLRHRPRRRPRAGIIGVKVWVYHGDEIPYREQETERALARARVGGSGGTGRRRRLLAAALRLRLRLRCGSCGCCAGRPGGGSQPRCRVGLLGDAGRDRVTGGAEPPAGSAGSAAVLLRPRPWRLPRLAPRHRAARRHRLRRRHAAGAPSARRRACRRGRRLPADAPAAEAAAPEDAAGRR